MYRIILVKGYLKDKKEKKILALQDCTKTNMKEVSGPCIKTLCPGCLCEKAQITGLLQKGNSASHQKIIHTVLLLACNIIINIQLGKLSSLVFW